MMGARTPKREGKPSEQANNGGKPGAKASCGKPNEEVRVGRKPGAKASRDRKPDSSACRGRKFSAQASRAVRAAALVVALVVVLCAIDGAFAVIREGARVARAASTVGAWDVEGGDFAVQSAFSSDAVAAIEAFSPGTARVVDVAPAWLAEEAFAPDGMNGFMAGSLVANDAGTVFGFMVSVDASQAFDEASRKLEGNGWQAVESGLAGCGTFVKDVGSCRWVLVSCTEIAGETSVVMQCPRNYS